jgi:hypothetical protein
MEASAPRLGAASDGDAEASAAFGPEPDAVADADATRAEDDAVLGVERRLAVDAADAAALKAAAVAARRAASEATNNELLAREQLEAARAEIKRLRLESSAAEDSLEFAALPESAAAALPAPAEPSPPVLEPKPRVDVAVGSSPPVEWTREARETETQTAWVGGVASAPLADVGVEVGPSLPGSERSTPPASPRRDSSARELLSPPADSVSASPLESLAAANLEFAFSPEVESPKNRLGESTPWSGASSANEPEYVLSPRKSAPSAALDARDARALAERLEAALTATAAAESRARVAEAAAVAAEAAAFDAVDMAMEYAEEAHSPGRTRRGLETPRSAAPRRAGSETPPKAVSPNSPKTFSTRASTVPAETHTHTPTPKSAPTFSTRRSVSPGVSLKTDARPPWGSSSKRAPNASAGKGDVSSPREQNVRRRVLEE